MALLSEPFLACIQDLASLLICDMVTYYKIDRYGLSDLYMINIKGIGKAQSSVALLYEMHARQMDSFSEFELMSY